MESILSMQQKRDVIRVIRETLPQHQCAKNRALGETLIIMAVIRLIRNKGTKYYRQERRNIDSFIESCSPNGGSLFISL